jgi:peptidoglycan DL-endopeptidase LytE
VRPNIAVPLVICLLLSIAPAFADSLTHTVSSGDSLSTIADRYGVSVNSLEARNHLTDSSVLQLGQQIIVPVHLRHHAAVQAAAPARSAGPGSVQAAAALRAARIGARHSTDRSASTSRIAVERALWTATHAGSAPPSIPGIQPFDVAQRVLALDAHITQTALRYLGVPYMWGGTSYSGVDCSGFVQSVFAKNGIELPRMADEQFAIGRRIAMGLLMPGDLVFFETYTSGASHVGIYLGHGRFIHASMRGVVIDALNMDYYASRYIGARRLVQ